MVCGNLFVYLQDTNMLIHTNAGMLELSSNLSLPPFLPALEDWQLKAILLPKHGSSFPGTPRTRQCTLDISQHFSYDHSLGALGFNNKFNFHLKHNE